MSVAHREFLRKDLVDNILKTENLEKIKGTIDNEVRMLSLFTSGRSDLLLHPYIFGLSLVEFQSPDFNQVFFYVRQLSSTFLVAKPTVSIIKLIPSIPAVDV